MNKKLIVSCLFLLGFASSHAISGEIVVTKEIYNNKILNNTLLGATENGAWKVYHKESRGRLFYSATGFVDEGKIWFNDKGEACSLWQKIRRGRAFCSKMLLDGDKISWMEADGELSTARIFKGDYSGW